MRLLVETPGVVMQSASDRAATHVADSSLARSLMVISAGVIP